MANSGLSGPYALNDFGIDSVVRVLSPGAYTLGHSSADGTIFTVEYVGRSDDDLRARLKCHIGQYPQFKAQYLPTARAAFEKECNLFHDFGETNLDNKVHPARPAASGWRCVRCGVRLLRCEALGYAA